MRKTWCVGWRQCLPFLKSCERRGVKQGTEGSKATNEVLGMSKEARRETPHSTPGTNAVASARGADHNCPRRDSTEAPGAFWACSGTALAAQVANESRGFTESRRHGWHVKHCAIMAGLMVLVWHPCYPADR